MAIYARKREEREQEARREKEAAAARAQAIENERLKGMEKRSEGVVGGAGAESEKEEGRMQKTGSEDEGDGAYYPGGAESKGVGEEVGE